jgi:4-aminobutyrate aminotransferase-like enzyme
MLVGLEFDRPAACAAFVTGCFEHRVLLGWTLHCDTVVRLAPPLTLSEAELDQALNVFDDVLG